MDSVLVVKLTSYDKKCKQIFSQYFKMKYDMNCTYLAVIFSFYVVCVLDKLT